MTTATEPKLGTIRTQPRSSAGTSEGDWGYENFPKEFWPKIREVLQGPEQFSATSTVIASALVNLATLEAVARKAGAEAMVKSVGGQIAAYIDDICPPWPPFPWPPRRRRLVLEEVMEILSGVVQISRGGPVTDSLNSIGNQIQTKLDLGM
jgi:hypothetical protein